MKCIIFFNMEIRVYKNMSDWSANKMALCQRVESSDLLFPYDSCVRAFKSIYGDSCIINFLVL